MSEVFSFRLNRNNPREARVIEFLENKLGAGYSLRQIIVEAVLKFDEVNQNTISTPILNELYMIMPKVNYLLEIFEDRNDLPFLRNENIPIQNLTSTFINSINKSFKPGIKIENFDI